MKSEKIGESSYSIKWYDLPTKIVRDLILVMLRSNRPSTLTAAKIFDLSLQGFCEVIACSNVHLKIDTNNIRYMYYARFRFAKRQRRISILYEQ